MTGISYIVTLKDDAPRAAMAALIRRMENAHGFYKNVGEHLVNSVQDNFDTERAPDGTPWKTLSAVTLERREAEGHAGSPILRISGALAGSINYRPSDEDVRVGTSLVYAAIHHFGGDSKGFMKATIPARPYLGMKPEDEDAILEIAEDWLAVE